MSIDASKIEGLLELYLEIEHSTIVDGEVTLGGNGTNSYEAANVIGVVFDILGIEPPEVTKKTFAKFCKQHGINKKYFDGYFGETEHGIKEKNT